MYRTGGCTRGRVDAPGVRTGTAPGVGADTGPVQLRARCCGSSPGGSHDGSALRGQRSSRCRCLVPGAQGTDRARSHRPQRRPASRGGTRRAPRGRAAAAPPRRPPGLRRPLPHEPHEEIVHVSCGETGRQRRGARPRHRHRDRHRAGLTLLQSRGRGGTWKRPKRVSDTGAAGTGSGRDRTDRATLHSAPRPCLPVPPTLTGVLPPQQLQEGGVGGPGESPGQRLRDGHPLREAKRVSGVPEGPEGSCLCPPTALPVRERPAPAGRGGGGRGRAAAPGRAAPPAPGGSSSSGGAWGRWPAAERRVPGPPQASVPAAGQPGTSPGPAPRWGGKAATRETGGPAGPPPVAAAAGTAVLPGAVGEWEGGSKSRSTAGTRVHRGDKWGLRH